MADTPILDAAVCAYLTAADTPIRRVANTHERIAAALRAALPWEPTAETIDAMAEGFTNGGAIYEDDRAGIADAYCAHPIMRELYDENGVPR